MQVSIEAIDDLERRMTVAVPREDIEPEIQNRLKSLVTSVKVNGFRPGKVPLRVVEQKFGPKVREEVIGGVIQTSFQQAVQQENLQVIGQPVINTISDVNNLDQGFSYTATFQVQPQNVSIHYNELVIEKPVVEITENDVEAMLHRLRQQRQSWNKVEIPAAIGHKVIIDFHGTVDGKAFEGSHANKLPLVLGENNPMGLENHLLGMCTGETREIDFTLPLTFSNFQLAGKTAHFTIYMHSVSEAKLPELNSEFAKALGIEDGNVDMLQQDTRANMQRELEFVVKNRIKQQVLTGLLHANPIAVPKSFVDDEVQRLRMGLQAQGKRPEEVSLHAAILENQARNLVRLRILMSELVKTNDFKVDEEKVKQLIERIAFPYEDSEAVVKSYYDNPQRLREIEAVVLEDQVIDWLCSQVKIIEKPTDFFTLMAKN
jgi:trigger factor